MFLLDDKTKKYLKRLGLGALSIACGTLIALTFMNVYPAITGHGEHRIVDGIFDLRGQQMDRAFRVEGEWERFAYANVRDLPIDFGAIAYRAELVHIPMSLVEVSSHSAAYRMTILSGYDITEAYIWMSPIDSEYTVIFNGERVFSYDMETTRYSILPMFSLAAFRLDFDLDREYQEFVIFVCCNDNRADFFHAEFIMGGFNDINRFLAGRLTAWALLTGLFVMLLIKRTISMTAFPEGMKTNLLTLVDFAIVVRLLIGLPEFYNVKTIMFGFSIPNNIIVILNFLPLMVISLVTIFVVAMVFKADGDTYKRWFIGISVMFGIIAMTLSFNTYWFATSVGFFVYLAFFVPCCYVSGRIFVNYIRNNKLDKIQILYLVSLVIVGGLIWYDMATMRQPYRNFFILTIGYLSVILVHMGASIWEHFIRHSDAELMRAQKYEEVVSKLEDNEYDKELMKTLQGYFVRTHKDTFSNIKYAIETNDNDIALRLVRSLKNSAWLIHEAHLANMAERVEMKLNEESTAPGGALAELESELKRVIDSISEPITIPESEPEAERTSDFVKDYIEKSPPLVEELECDRACEREGCECSGKPEQESDGLCNRDVIALLNKVQAKLKNQDTSCFDLLDELAKISGSEELCAQIKEFDFRTAAVTLNTLKESRLMSYEK